MVLDNNIKLWTEGDELLAFLRLEAFAGPAQGPSVDIPPSAAVSGPLSGVKRSIDKVPCVLAHGKRNGARITDRNHRQLAQNGLHRQNVKHLLVTLALIHNTGAAVQKPVCDKKKIIFRNI